MEEEKKTCDVCRYVDGDMSKKDAFFCGRCDAWICGYCKDKYLRRALAMALRWLDQDVRIW